MIKNLIKKLIAKAMIWLEMPGIYYQNGLYVYNSGVTISPNYNKDLVSYPSTMKMYEVFINTFDRAVIEEDVIFGHQVMVLTGSLDYEAGKVSREGRSKGAIEIKRGAWTASRCILLGGVTIGENSVIGAGSVVTKSVPLGELWAGNPETNKVTNV